MPAARPAPHEPVVPGAAPDNAPAGATPERGHTIEELEALSGVPARTIRFYRQSGLIDPPVRIGRNAYYTPDQLARLQMVAGLREQGLGLDAISRVLTDPDGERDSLANMLRLGAELRTPWIEDGEAVLSEHDVLETLGIDNPNAIPILERYEVIVRVPKSNPVRFHVSSLGQLQLAGQLASLGVTESLAFDSWQLIRREMSVLARDLVTMYTSRPREGLPGWPTSDDVGAAFRKMQPITLRAVELAFAREMQIALDEWIGTGGVFEADKLSDGMAAVRFDAGRRPDPPAVDKPS